jgi:hypothetical protein
MFRRRWLNAGLALLVGGGLAAGIPSLAAAGQSPPVEQTSPPGSPDILLSAQLVSRGAAANVNVQYLCQPGDSPEMQIILNQRSGNATTGANTFLFQAPVICDGQIRTAQILITAAPKPFVQGTAIGQLFFYSFFSGVSTDVRTIPVTKK